MCAVGDGYKYASENHVCHDQAIYHKCKTTNGIYVPYEPCTSAGLKCNDYSEIQGSVCTGAYHCEDSHFYGNGDCCQNSSSTGVQVPYTNCSYSINNDLTVVNIDTHVITKTGVERKCNDYNDIGCYATPWSLDMSGREEVTTYRIQTVLNSQTPFS